MVADKVYLVRYQASGSWYIGLVKAWNPYIAVTLINRLRKATQVEKPVLLNDQKLHYYRNTLKIEEVN